MHEQADDTTLIQSVLNGNESAYAILVMRYQRYVFTLAMRYVNNREVAEELAQDIFVKAYRFLADFKGKSKFSSWLYTITNSTCLSYLRSKKHDLIFPGDDQMIIFSDQNTGTATDELERKSQNQLITKAINLLSEPERQIITLFYQADQSIEEIGMEMGMSAGNVKVRLFRGRQKLKEILQPLLKE